MKLTLLFLASLTLGCAAIKPRAHEEISEAYLDRQCMRGHVFYCSVLSDAYLFGETVGPVRFRKDPQWGLAYAERSCWLGDDFRCDVVKGVYGDMRLR